LQGLNQAKFELAATGAVFESWPLVFSRASQRGVGFLVLLTSRRATFFELESRSPLGAPQEVVRASAEIRCALTRATPEARPRLA